MADQLHLNLWFPSFAEPEILLRTLSVIKQFPFSQTKPGVTYVAAHPLDWSESPIVEETFDYGTVPETAANVVHEFLHEDYAYEFQVWWDLWVPEFEGDLDAKWVQKPQLVSFIAMGTSFEDGIYKEDGHIQLMLGLDTPFLFEEEEFTPAIEQRIKANIQKLVSFTNAVEQNCGVTGRVLWSEGEDNLAQKLIAKLQKVQ
jgi:hypothetical protein